MLPQMGAQWWRVLLHASIPISCRGIGLIFGLPGNNHHLAARANSCAGSPRSGDSITLRSHPCPDRHGACGHCRCPDLKTADLWPSILAEMLNAARYLRPGPGAAARISDTSSILRTVGSLRGSCGIACTASSPRPASQEPQCHDPGIERGRRDLGIGHINWYRRSSGVAVSGDRLRKPAKSLMRMWAFWALSPIPRPHIFNHPLT